MKTWILIASLLIPQMTIAQVWGQETFSDETNGDVSGTTTGGTWSVTTTPTGGASSFSRQNPLGVLPVFRANQTGTEGVWATSAIDISSTGAAKILMRFYTLEASATDYVRAYYKVDGGPEVLFYELIGGLLSGSLETSVFVIGNSLEIIVRAMENTAGNSFFGFGPPRAMGIDDVQIDLVPKVYSRANADWDQASTWSTTGFTGLADAPTPPTSGQIAVIGGGFTVNLDADATVGGVEVQNTGTILYVDPGAIGIDLGIEGGLVVVNSGGVINGNSLANARINFNQDIAGASLQVDAGGVVSIDDVALTINAENFHYFTGGGSLTIADDILIGADDATLTNNMTTTLAVGDRIEFSNGTTNSSFVNNGMITAATLFFDDDNNFFTNASTATFSGSIMANGTGDNDNTITNNNLAILSFVNLDGNAGGGGATGGRVTILNSGTINQSGTFVSIPNSTNTFNDINNLAGATWNYSGTGHDTDVRLFANNPTNTFNYGLSGAQQIITPVTGNGYNNLTLQSASVAAKTALGNFSVSGNYTRSGSATFANGGFTVTLNGSASAQTVSAVGGETFAGLTINNSTGSSPQITLSNAVSVTGTLTMTDGNVNLNGTTFTLTGSLVHNLTSAAGWMYGGSINRSFADAAITIGNVAGFLPIGTSVYFRPFFFGKNNGGGSNSAGTITISHSDPGTTATGLSIADTSGPIILRNNSAWTSVLTGGTGATFGIRYGGTGMGTVTDVTHLHSMLLNSVIQTHVPGSGSLTDPRAERSGLLVASGHMTNVFYIGSDDLASPLPIELFFFNAKLKNDVVELSWATASEKDNDFFTIERATNIEQFETVGDVIDGKGTTNERSDYFTQDETPIYGRSYYRLKQTDFDGKFSYSDLQVINYEGPRFSVLRVFPNPSEGDALSIEVTGLKDQPSVPVQIYNTQGQKVYEHVFEVRTPGTLKEDLNLGSPLKQGLYIIKAGQTLQLTQKIIVD